MQNIQQRKWKNVEKLICTFAFILPFLFVLLIFVARWPRWWELTVPELSPMTWMQSILLFINALTAMSLALFCYLRHDQAQLRGWAILSMGFFYLMLDERFAIHERFRDLYLAPEQVKIPLFFWTEPGDFLLLFYLLIGLLVGFYYLKLFQVRKVSFYWLIIGIIFSTIAILMDSFHFQSYPLIVQNWQQFLEELLEISSMCSFFVSLFLLFSFHIQQINAEYERRK